MKTFWTPYISDNTTQAICWTLIHSLWIGVVIALLAGLVIVLTRKSKPALRYQLLCGILLLFVSAIGVTFYLQLKTAEAYKPAPPPQIIIANLHYTPGVQQVNGDHINIVNSFVNLIKQNTDLIFIAWLLLFMLKSLKMAGGLLYIQRIRNYRIHDIPEEFKHKIEMFARQIGISQTVRLMQSELVKVPVAVGWLKPVILLPMGIILQLPVEQLESILWHELAHIRRRDYLVNILQGLVETVFFFNPGLLWLSSLIRAEREACCDDMVLSRMNRKANYLEALLAFSNDTYTPIKLAMSMGSGNQLRDRMRRMVNRENKRLAMSEKVVLVLGLAILSVFTGLPKTTQAAVEHLANVIIKKADPQNKNSLLGTINKELTQQSQLDTPRARKDTAMRFKSVLFKHGDADLDNNEISAQDIDGTKYHIILSEGRIVAMDINGLRVKDDNLSKYQYIIRDIDQELLLKERVRRSDTAMAKFQMMKSADGIKFRKDSIRYSAKFKNMDDQMAKFAAKRQAFADRQRKDSLNYTEQQNRAFSVIANLVQDKVVADPASVKWFGLSDSELIVNGQKLPAEMQQRYESKYGVHKNYGLYYGPVEMQGTGVFIDADKQGRPPLPPPPMQPQRPVNPDAKDTLMWNKPRYTKPQVIKQKNPEDEQNAKMEQLMRRQEASIVHVNEQIRHDQAEQQHKNNELIKQQNAFAEDQNKKREYIMRWQENYLIAQDAKRRQILADQDRMIQEQRAKQKVISKNMNDVLASIADDLISDNIVKDKSDLHWFRLTNKALVVNGKVQSEDAHQKLMNKYLRPGQYPEEQQISQDPDFGWHYNKNGNEGFGIMTMSGFEDN